MKKYILSLLCLLLTSCAIKSAYTVDSVPSSASVTINGEYAGTTPFTHSSYCTTFLQPDVVVSKPGFKDTTATLSYEPHVGNIVVDAIVFWPMLFVNAECPKDHYQFQLHQ